MLIVILKPLLDRNSITAQALVVEWLRRWPRMPEVGGFKSHRWQKIFFCNFNFKIVKSITKIKLFHDSLLIEYIDLTHHTSVTSHSH